METTSYSTRHVALGEGRSETRANLVRGAHGHRRLGNHDPVFADVLADGVGDREHMCQVGRTVLARRRADRDELKEPVRDTFCGVGGEFHASRFGVALDQPVEPGSWIGTSPRWSRCNLLRIDIDADDVVTRVGQAGARNQTDVAGAEDRHAHGLCLLIR